MQIPQERLEKYAHFASLNSPDGRIEHYEPERGLEALLSSVTPDPKVMVLRAMARNKNQYFYSASELHTAVLEELRILGLPKNLYPIKYESTWAYCEHLDEYGGKVDGSLVNIGAIIKHLNVPTPEGLKTAYQISNAGVELAIPIGEAAIEFVSQAANSGLTHKYDSMWRLLNSVMSRTERRRQLAVYCVVKYLVENEGYHRLTDIAKDLEGKISFGSLSKILNSLGNIFMIDYQSAHRDRDGIRAIGWNHYFLSNSYKSLLEAELSTGVSKTPVG